MLTMTVALLDHEWEKALLRAAELLVDAVGQRNEAARENAACLLLYLLPENLTEEVLPYVEALTTFRATHAQTPEEWNQAAGTLYKTIRRLEDERMERLAPRVEEEVAAIHRQIAVILAEETVL